MSQNLFWKIYGLQIYFKKFMANDVISVYEIIEMCMW